MGLFDFLHSQSPPDIESFRRRYPLQQRLDETKLRSIFKAGAESSVADIPNLIATVLHDPEEDIRETAVLTLGRFRAYDASAVLECVLHCETEPARVRVQVAEEFGRWGSRGADSLIRALNVKNVLVKCAILDGLQRSAESREIRQRIVNIVQEIASREADDDVKSKASYVLRVIK